MENFDYSDYESIRTNSCAEYYLETAEEMEAKYRGKFCKADFDSILCWPPAPINGTVTLSCSSELFDLDESQNATRYCTAYGNWTMTDYSKCESSMSSEVLIYFIGYFISLVTLLIALGVFTFFKDLQCLRNTIHKNLMWSYIFTYTTWIFILVMIRHIGDEVILCNFLITVYYYFHNTTFFWMFVEGLYLYSLVVETMTRRHFTYRECAIVGWGVPLFFVIIWTIARSIMADAMSMCWIDDNPVDWVNNSAQLIVLILNLFFLVNIMWVLITKLRTASTVEIRQSYKAAKALLLLTPLLGITYVLTIYTSTPLFANARAILLSTQGFAVAMLYCFLTAEVQRTVSHRIENWKANRSLGSNRTSTSSRNSHWWSRSRSHSMRRHTEWTLVNAEEIQDSMNQSTIPKGNGITQSDIHNS